MGTNLIRAMLLASGSASIAVAAFPAAAHAQEASYQIDIPAQSLGDALRALGRATKQNIVFDGAVVRGKRSAAVQGRLTAGEALQAMLSGSGLVMSRGSGGALTVRAGNAPGAANGGAVQGQATLVGSVRDHKTGAALKGARVEVVETGASTSTGDLGDFRFTRLPTGDVTLRVSYLGFPEQTETVAVVGGLTNRADVYLGSGVTTEIVVIGQVSARAQALNQERTAENSTTVISGDLLGNFNGTTISDSLRRAPGVAFEQNATSSSDGTNIIVRGLAPDYNQVKLNGLALPEGSGTGRSANLNNLLSDSVSEVKISKTLLASQDSYGTGGLVEIETKSPLDRPKRYFNVSADATKYGKGFGEEYLLSGTASMRIGPEGNFGISASVQYRKENISQFAYNVAGVLGPYLPLLPNGMPASPQTLDPRTPFPFYDGAEYLLAGSTVSALDSDVETRNVNLSAEWQVSSSTNLRLDYVQSRREEERFSNRYRIGMIFDTYALAPVPGLGGEERYVYSNGFGRYTANSQTGLQSFINITDSLSFRGESAFGPLTMKYSAGYAKGRSRQPFSGDISLNSQGIPFSGDTLLPEALNPITGTIITPFGPRTGRDIPAPLLTKLGLERLRNESLSIINGYSSTLDNGGQSSNWTGDFSGKYEFGTGPLKYLEAGITFTRSTYRRRLGPEIGYSPLRDENNNPRPVGDIGLAFDDLPFSTGSGDQLYRLVTRESFEELVGRLEEYAAAGFLTGGRTDLDPLFSKQPTREEALAGFVQGRVDIGKLEVIAGVRLDRNHVKASYLNGDRIFDENFQIDLDYFLASQRIVNESDTLTTVLPRVLLNYRPQENIVVRGGYFSTVARPQVSQLNSAKSLTYFAARFFGPTFSQPSLSIVSGNPALKPARTHNFDLSAEWYDGGVGVIKLSAFYKRINNLIENNRLLGFDSLGDYQLPDHPVINNLPDDVFVELTYPVNSPDPATVWGFEAAVERQLTFLPGVLSGLGVYANYAYTRSKKTATIAWFEPIFDDSGNAIDFRQSNYQVKLPFDSSPRHSGTVGLTFTKPGFDASLYYTAQARRQASGGAPYGMDIYSEASNSLDLRAVYQFKLGGRDVRMSFEGKDLLRGTSDPVTEQSVGGVGDIPKYYTSGNYFGGRKFSFGLSVTL